jgi:hypothetical protein
MKNKLLAIIALLKSRAYLDSQYEATERNLMPRNDSHCECKPKQKYQSKQNDKSQSETIQRIQTPGDLWQTLR